MGHPEREHELMIEVARLTRECNSLHTRLASETQRADRGAKDVAETLDSLATALRERDEARHGLNEWCKAAMQERARVTAAESERDALRAEVKRLREALTTIFEWTLPPSNRQWDDGTPMSYGAAFGSNGERDYMRKVARAALASGGDRG